MLRLLHPTSYWSTGVFTLDIDYSRRESDALCVGPLERQAYPRPQDVGRNKRSALRHRACGEERASRGARAASACLPANKRPPRGHTARCATAQCASLIAPYKLLSEQGFTLDIDYCLDGKVILNASDHSSRPAYPRPQRVGRNKRSALRRSCLAELAERVEFACPVLRKYSCRHVAVKG